MSTKIEFVGGPKCGTVVAYGGVPDRVTDWHEGDVVAYTRRDPKNADVDKCRPLVSNAGHRMYDYERVVAL